MTRGQAKPGLSRAHGGFCPNNRHARTGEPEFGLRLGAAAASVLLGTIGSVGMWSVVVALPAVQAEFGVARADASLPYTLAMIGFGLGAVAIGRLVDRFGIVVPADHRRAALGFGFVASGLRAEHLRLRARQHR